MIAYAGWKAAGSPATPATCIADFVATMREHRYVVYIYGNAAHQKAVPAEDHMPYSATPWPGAQPYPKVLACDVMPGGALDWRVLGERIVADKNAGKAGTEFIKYVNYTDAQGRCWHASWTPSYKRTSSGDTGHIHVSARTDYADKHTNYDPVTGGGSAPAAPAAGTAPAWPGRVLRQGMSGGDVAMWQTQMKHRGWAIGVDGAYGPQSASICRQFQAEKHLAVDALVGNDTWRAAWTAQIT